MGEMPRSGDGCDDNKDQLSLTLYSGHASSAVGMPSGATVQD